MFSGIRCAQCGMAFESTDYQKITNHLGLLESVYWFNPKISDLTDVVVYFCGPQHSLEWYQKALEAKKAAQDES
jgi:hypothetical protein